ncbi:recombinase family protein [Burkholderia ambifaria]|uniref:recombinase family protein n=1 Tax=Burkholderia cepacia complex TaxID=87882 RepID=UPI001B909569|nr:MULTISPECIES: recombinase family protein [Burkholderia cepacia complex]MBR8067861.1 recombinase family protein [Burkholderia ambifaria]MBR8278847.1 recombinase family protein [Burkholderia cenocepacia]
MIIGYARVSTEEQNLDLQINALNRAGCVEIFSDQGISGSVFSRPGLEAALAKLSPGDMLIVWRLDRLGRSLVKLVKLISELEEQKIEFLSITESINTRSSGGMLTFHIMAALAQFERSLISERTRAGMAAAKARGKVIGRKKALDGAKRAKALDMLDKYPLKEVARFFGIHPRTLKRTIACPVEDGNDSS